MYIALRSSLIIISGQSNFQLIWQKDRIQCIATAHGRFCGIRQVMTLCTPPSTWFLGLTWDHNPNGISTSSAVFCTAHGTESLYFTMGSPFPPSKLFLPIGDLNPHPIHGSFGTSESSTQMASGSVQSFLHSSWLRVPILTIRCPFPRQNCPFPWGIWTPGGSGPPSNTWFHAPQAHPSPKPKQYRYLEWFSGFCRAHYCDRMTDRQTDRPCYSVCNNRPHLRTAIWPNNTLVAWANVAWHQTMLSCWLLMLFRPMVTTLSSYFSLSQADDATSNSAQVLASMISTRTCASLSVSM